MPLSSTPWPSLSLCSLIPGPHPSPFSPWQSVSAHSFLYCLTPPCRACTHYMPPATSVPLLICFSLPPLIYSLSYISSGHFLNGSYCSFEDGECSWKSIAGRSLSWRRLQLPAKATRQSCPSSGGQHTSLMILWTLIQWWSGPFAGCLACQCLIRNSKGRILQ